MNVQINPKPRFMTSLQSLEDLRPEHRETFTMQEQFTGPLPSRSERPAAEILVERLAETTPGITPPVFIP
jgi:hypothetical protein